MKDKRIIEFIGGPLDGERMEIPPDWKRVRRFLPISEDGAFILNDGKIFKPIEHNIATYRPILKDYYVSINDKGTERWEFE